VTENVADGADRSVPPPFSKGFSIKFARIPGVSLRFTPGFIPSAYGPVLDEWR
jgi:hypothetical protein